MYAGIGIKEMRGGDRKSHKYADKLLSVKKFIQQLKGKESHYGRSKSRRIYLSSEYSISSLWKLYNGLSPERLQVKYKYFSLVFNKYFNIGFGSPATDTCGFCVRHHTESLLATNSSERQKLSVNLTIHKRRAKEFFKLMAETPPNSETLCFDLQQQQLLPKVPIQDAFYAQQLAFYFFCITDIGTKSPIFYSWMEHQAGRGAVEVTSALRDFLLKKVFGPDTKHVRLFADGCAGQNKNSYVVHTLMHWLYHDAPKTINSITIFFPIRGHSYMPADRVFGRAEKILRKHSVLKTPESYYDLYSQIGEIRKLGEDWKLYNIKAAEPILNKVQAISAAKRILIKKSADNRILMKSELLYRSDDPTKKYDSLLKQGHTMDQITLPEVPLVHTIKEKKLQSLHKLLIELSGPNWPRDPQLLWFEPIVGKHRQKIQRPRKTTRQQKRKTQRPRKTTRHQKRKTPVSKQKIVNTKQ